MPFCTRPWSTFMIAPDYAGPECRLAERMGVRPSSTLKDTLNHPGIGQLRAALAEEHPEAYDCQDCPDADPGGALYETLQGAFSTSAVAGENASANRAECQAGNVTLSSLPISVSIDLGYRCNFRCLSCHVVLEPRDVAADLVQELWANADSLVHLHVSGGEPLCYGTFRRFLHGPGPVPCSLSITTNGHWLSPALFADFERFAHVNLHFSLDSFRPEVLARFRLGADAERLYDNLALALSEARRRNSRSNPGMGPALYVALQLVPTSFNVREIPGYLDHAASLGVEAVHFCLLDTLQPALEPTAGMSAAEVQGLAQEIYEALRRNDSRLEYNGQNALLARLGYSFPGTRA